MTTASNISEELEKKYKDSIDLPQTEFPMRGNGPVREPEFQSKWQETSIYEEALANRKDAELFVLHDGPPYLSSDKIHIGTALNKILKDIVIKYKNQRGFKTPYIPGYDSHGLPIENAVVKKIKGGRNAVSVAELREQCKDFALANLKGQEENFKRLGVLGDWDNPYITLKPEFEAEQIRLFAEMAAKGYIYRGLKTVYWSYGCETALADAEVEYNEEHVSNSIYVNFPIKPETIPASFKHKNLLENEANVTIWTTTPWTLPGNMAIALNKEVDYVIAQAKREEKVKGQDASKISDFGKIVIAQELTESVSKSAQVELEILSESFKGAELEGLVTTHPLLNRPSPIIFGEHVTTESGTGCVHTAPGHGQEDFEVGKEFGLDIHCPVDPRGVYTKEAGELTALAGFDADKLISILKTESPKLQDKIKAELPQGKLDLEGFHVIKQGNDLIILALKLSGALLRKSKITHSYPYCWRSKTPLLYRATDQWFCSIDGFRTEALKAIDEVKWIPERGRNRIYAMVEDRGDWCISRQRTWGVPIPVFYDKSKIDDTGNYQPILDLELIEHVAKIFESEGSSSWYTKEASELIPESLHSKYNPNNLVRETDTMDVWFDSGSSHKGVVAARPELSPDGKFRKADMYLEGSDQHRGWFQSSLLTSVATNGTAPYHSVLTHGFVMDEKGRKMSKSIGNVVDPKDVIAEYGADILRLWVASVDYSVDIKVGETMFKQLSDIYRNFRNTSRYMLGNLFDFKPQEDSIAYDELWDLDRLILHRLQNLVTELTTHFDNYQFFKYYQVLQNFCSVDLSAFYFDIIKDRLYTHGSNSKSRRAAQTVLLELLSVINRLFVPVIPHMAEDIFSHMHAQIREHYKQDQEFFSKHASSMAEPSILLSNWPLAKAEYQKPELASKWDTVLKIREQVNKELELLRADKVIAKSLEASVKITAPKETYEILKSIEDEIKAVFIISDYSLEEADELTITTTKFESVKCVRCWKHFKAEEITEGVCSVCHTAVNN